MLLISLAVPRFCTDGIECDWGFAFKVFSCFALSVAIISHSAKNVTNWRFLPECIQRMLYAVFASLQRSICYWCTVYF